MTDTTNPKNTGMDSHAAASEGRAPLSKEAEARRAAQEEAVQEEQLRETRERRKALDRAAAEEVAREDARLKAVGTTNAEFDGVLDAKYAVVVKALPFAGLAQDIEAADARYRERATVLGVPRWELDQALNRHPVARLLPWLRTFGPKVELK